MTEKAEELKRKWHDHLSTEGITKEDSVKFYAEVSDIYDEAISAMTTKSPSLVAEALADQVDLAKRETSRILDVAAGTGRVGVCLHEKGFRNIEALEPCKELLEKLEQKGVYRRSHCQFFGSSGDTRLASEGDGSYDAVVVAGAFIKGHLSADALREAARLVRKGGYFVNAYTHKKGGEEYERGIEEEMVKMEEEKLWRMLKRSKFRNSPEVEGTCLIFEIK